MEGKTIKVKSFKINVIIPESLDDNGVGNFIMLYNKKHELSKASTYFDTSAMGRGYPFHFKVDPPKQDLEDGVDIHLSDVPGTLSTIVESLKLYLPMKEVGPDVDINYLEKRELENFSKVLKFLIEKNSITKNVIQVETDVIL